MGYKMELSSMRALII